MSVTQGLLTGAWLFWLQLGYGLVLLWALWRAPWRILAREPRLQHLYLGATVVIMLMWQLRAGISPGMAVHFLGVTTLTLMFGWELAIISATLALTGMSLIGLEAWDGFSVNGLCAAVVPALASYYGLRLVERLFPPNFFVYLFAGVFANAALAATLSGLSMMLVLGLAGVYSLDKILNEYLLFLPLIMFPEGLLNGILMTGMMVYYPDWIRTFDAKRYIDEQ
ncbi:energy-coupling factor ABC transporter permease [Balneatrix alpica]|uniref:Energy-coupling factor ABC transporter permease n=1 Tax=Balneatrix alpica TaxID=75684 RepID=A0ABV5ZF93_9GAMM|nr:energy-coupling factor ABC transporter permease [Balneatrix alpica]